MVKAEKAAKSVLFLMLFSLGSKLAGFVREAMIADKFGAGADTDTYFIAISAVSLFAEITILALYTTMIPLLTEIESKEGRQSSRNFVNNLLNISLLLSCIMILIGWFAAPAIMQVLAYGFKGNQYELAVVSMRIGMPTIIFSSMVGVFRGYLQSEMRFIELSAADFSYNFVFIVFLLFFANTFGVTGLIATSVLAVGSQFLMQTPSLRKLGYKYAFKLNFNDKYIKKMFRLLPPILVSVAVTEINKVVGKSMASGLINGSISALNYSNRIKSQVLDIFIITMTTVLYPILSREANEKSLDGFKKVVKMGINTTILITVPAAVGMIVLAKPIVALAFERGAFDAADTIMTAQALTFYSFGLVGISLRMFLYKVFYSLKDTKTPMTYGFFNVALNVVLNFILVKHMAHRGLALGTSIAETISTGFLLYELIRKVGRIRIVSIYECGLKSLISSSVMGFIVYFLYGSFNGNAAGGFFREFSILLLVSLVGVFVYLAVICLLRVDEVKFFADMILSKLRHIFKGRSTKTKTYYAKQ